MKTYKPEEDEDIAKIAVRMVALAEKRNDLVRTFHNGVDLLAVRGTRPEDLVTQYNSQCSSPIRRGNT
jgi:hypothetical protein